MPDIGDLLALFLHFPTFAVLVGGLVFGAGFTQFIKKAFLDLYYDRPWPVTERRFKLTVRVLAASSTYAFTLSLWHGLLAHTGAEEVVSVGTAFSAPLVYDGTRAMIAWKFPQLVRHWGHVGDP
jgi:hypothetical protein